MKYRYDIAKGLQKVKTKTAITITALGLVIGGGGMSLALLGTAHAISPVNWMGINWTQPFGSIALNGSNLDVTSTHYGAAHYNTPASFRSAAVQSVSASFVDNGTASPQLWFEQETHPGATWLELYTPTDGSNYSVYVWNEETNSDHVYVSPINRTSGAHTFGVTKLSNGTVNFYIDGNFVYNSGNIIDMQYLGDVYLAAAGNGTVTYTNYETASRTVTCTPTGYHNLTAAQIGGNVTGMLDATGCDIGVYYDVANNGNVDNAVISGAKYYGVAVNGGTSVNVSNSQINNIGESPFNGSQHGVGIYYTNGATGTVSGNNISQYQKGGIVVSGGSSVDSLNNTVTGLGPVNFIAQNGIEYYSASGIIRGNNVSGNFYTGTVGVGPNPGGQNPPGWQYTSGGILLYTAPHAKQSMNHFSDNQKNLEMVP